MSNTIKTSRAQMIDAALAIIEERGVGGVSVRNIARRLSVSTQPIYREFGDADGLMQAVRERGFEIWWEYVKGDADEQAARYVMFAVERGKLFDFLLREKSGEAIAFSRLKYALIPETDIIDRLSALTGLDREKTYDLHFKLWLALHGLAIMAADGRTAPSACEVKAFIKELTRQLAAGSGVTTPYGSKD